MVVFTYMHLLARERVQTAVFWFAFISAILLLVVVLALVGFEAYIRWTINKDFSFLGGFELETLTASAAVLTLGIARLYRPQ